MCFSIVLLLLLAVSGALAGQEGAISLDGTLDGRLRLSANSEGFDAAVNDLSLLLRLRWSDWSLFTRAAITDDSFGFLAIGAEGRLGPLDTRAQAVFSPDAGAFRYLFWMTNWRIGDVRFGNTLFLSETPASSFDQIAVRGAVAGMTWNGFMRFALCDDPRFLAAQVRVNALLFSCLVPAEAKLSFSCDDGFDLLELTVRRIPFRLLTGLLHDTTLDLRLRIEDARLQVVPLLSTFAGAACAGIQPYLELAADGFPGIDGLDVYGIVFSCAIGESVGATAATCFDDDGARNREVTGETDYFERLSLAGIAPGCCGGPIEWGIDTYFAAEPKDLSLFGWGRTDILLAFPLGPMTFVSIEGEFESTGQWTLLFGFSTQF